MREIATLTLNPTIDVAYDVERVVHTHKMRALAESHDPGGGGINVARVLVRLGAGARCYYMSGGASGVALDGLLDLHQLVRTRIPIAGETRIAAAALDRESGREYRFIPPGPAIAEREWQECLEVLAGADCDYFVASGSLPRGVPADFYARVTAMLRPKGVRLVLDSSGEALKAGLAGGGVHLVKPSLGELEQVAGHELRDEAAVAAAAMDVVRAGQSEYVAVTLGHRGAILARAEGTLFLPAIEVETRSAVGAGDSFLAAMVFALAGGAPVEEAFRLGIAAGAAAVLTPGTGLARADDIRRLHRLVQG